MKMPYISGDFVLNVALVLNIIAFVVAEMWFDDLVTLNWFLRSAWLSTWSSAGRAFSIAGTAGSPDGFPEKPEKMLDFSKKCGIVKETIPHNPGLRF